MTRQERRGVLTTARQALTMERTVGLPMPVELWNLALHVAGRELQEGVTGRDRMRAVAVVNGLAKTSLFSQKLDQDAARQEREDRDADPNRPGDFTVDLSPETPEPAPEPEGA